MSLAKDYIDYIRKWRWLWFLTPCGVFSMLFLLLFIGSLVMIVVGMVQ